MLSLVYIKVTKSAGHSCVQLAVSFCDDNGKPRKRVVSTLGRADETDGKVATSSFLSRFAMKTDA